MTKFIIPIRMGSPSFEAKFQLWGKTEQARLERDLIIVYSMAARWTAIEVPKTALIYKAKDIILKQRRIWEIAILYQVQCTFCFTFPTCTPQLGKYNLLSGSQGRSPQIEQTVGGIQTSILCFSLTEKCVFWSAGLFCVFKTPIGVYCASRCAKTFK